MPACGSHLPCLTYLCISSAFAQVPRPAAVVSPEVSGDRTVTFRIYAPGANDVQVTGDWMGPKDKPIPMSKRDDGVWVGSAGPLQPNVYFYTFSINGVRAPDPANPNTIVSGGRFPQSSLEIRADAPQPWEPQSVPKGSIHVEFFDSKLQGRERSYYVYSPPGYESKRLPVLILLPGTPGTEADWVTVGSVNRIFDNLIAQGKVKPMLVLMPRADVLLKGGTRADNLREFEPLLILEVLPHLLAIAGYSLGGELALTVGLRHPNFFRTVGSFAGSIFERDFEDRFGKAWADPKAISSLYRLIWIGCGSGDLLLPGNRKFSDVLNQKNIRHTFTEIAGYHSMPTFRALLIEFAQLLFR